MSERLPGRARLVFCSEPRPAPLSGRGGQCNIAGSPKRRFTPAQPTSSRLEVINFPTVANLARYLSETSRTGFLQEYDGMQHEYRKTARRLPPPGSTLGRFHANRQNGPISYTAYQISHSTSATIGVHCSTIFGSAVLRQVLSHQQLPERSRNNSGGCGMWDLPQNAKFLRRRRTPCATSWCRLLAEPELPGEIFELISIQRAPRPLAIPGSPFPPSVQAARHCLCANPHHRARRDRVLPTG